MAEASDHCLAWAEAGRGFADRFLVVCGKSKGHATSQDPKRREHFDADKNVRWADEETEQ